MATSGSSGRRDVEFNVDVTTAGSDGVTKLAEQVRKLGKDGGDAAPEFERLANELDKIANQSKAVETFSQLEAAVREVGNAQAEAAAKSEKLTESVREASAASAQYRNEQQAARDVLRQAQVAQDQVVASTRDLKAAYQGAEKQSTEYKSALSGLNAALVEAKDDVRKKADALRDATSEVTKAENAEKKLTKQFNDSQEQLKSITKELGNRTTALNQSIDAANQLGLDTDKLSTAQEELSTALQKVSAEAKQQQDAVVSLRAAEEEAAQAALELANRTKELAKILQSDYEATVREAAQATKDFAEQQKALANESSANNLQQLQQAMARIQATTLTAATTFEEFNKQQKLLATQSSADNLDKLQQAMGRVQARTLEAIQAQRDLEAESKRAADALDNAFSTIGVRSIAAIREEINQVGASLIRLQNNTKISGEEFDRAFAVATARIDKLNAEIERTPGALNKTRESANLVGEAFRTLAAYYGAFELGSGFIAANVQLEALRRSLVITTGSTDNAAKQIKFLSDTADKAGIPIRDLAQSYSTFVASATSSGISLTTVNTTFAAVAQTLGSLGISSDAAGGALNALGQIASKGKVSMEELRQQLGDRLPAALAATAKGLGLTTAQLDALVTSGKLLGDNQFFEAFARGITTSFKGADERVTGLAASIARFKNTYDQTLQALGESGVVDAVATAFTGLGKAVAFTGNVLVSSGTAIGTGAGVIRELAAAALSFDGDRFSRAVTLANESSVKLFDTFDKKTGGFFSFLYSADTQGLLAAKRLQDLALANKAAADSAAAATPKLDAQTQTLGTLLAALDKPVISLAQLQVRYTEATTAAEKYAAQAVISSETSKTEAANLTAVAAILGDEVAKRDAAVKAADAHFTALSNLATARQLEATLAKREVDQTKEYLQSLGPLTEAQAKQIAALQKEAESKQLVADRTRELALQSELVVSKAELERQVYENNSKNLDLYTEAVKRAAVELARISGLYAQGKATADQLTLAQTALANNTALLRDAQADLAKEIEHVNAANQAKLIGAQASINVELEQARTAEAYAKTLGNQYGVVQAQIAQREIQIRQIEATIASTLSENNALIAQLQVKLDLLKITDPENKAAQDALSLSIAAANAKIKETDAQKEKIKQLQLERDSLSINGTLQSQVSSSNVQAINSEVSAREKNIAALEKEDELKRREQAREATSKLGKNTAGDVVNAAGNSYVSILNQLKSMGLGDSQAATIAKKFTDQNGNVPYLNNSGIREYGATSLGEAIVKAASQELIKNPSQTQSTASNNTQATTNTATSGNTGGTGAGAATPSVPVNIYLPGATAPSTINVASTADAKAMEAVLRQLNSQAGTAA